MNTQTPTKNRGRTHVLVKGKQFLLLITYKTPAMLPIQPRGYTRHYCCSLPQMITINNVMFIQLLLVAHHSQLDKECGEDVLM